MPKITVVSPARTAAEFRAAMVKNLDHRITAATAESLRAWRVRDSARIGGEITALRQLRDFLAEVEFPNSPD